MNAVAAIHLVVSRSRVICKVWFQGDDAAAEQLYYLQERGVLVLSWCNRN